MGSKLLSRERIEAYSGGTAGIITDFREAEIIQGDKRSGKKLWSQNMGYAEELKSFFEAPVEQGRKNFRDAVSATLTTFAAVESLQERKPIAIAPMDEQ